MPTLFKLNVLLTLRLRTWGLVTVLFLLLALAHAQLLAGRSPSLNLWDYLLFSGGGLIVHDRFLTLIGWLASLVPMLMFLSHLTSVTGGYDAFLLFRAGSRGRWWLAKMLAMVCLAVLYALWYWALHLLVGVVIYPTADGWSAFASEAYGQAISLDVQPWLLLVRVWLLFVTGLVAVAAWAQTLTLPFRHSVGGQVILAAILFAASAAFVQGVWPRELSPLLYPSFRDLFQQGAEGWNSYWSALRFNVLAAVAATILCVLMLRRFSFSSRGE
jgi:hypothetical protein